MKEEIDKIIEEWKEEIDKIDNSKIYIENKVFFNDKVNKPYQDLERKYKKKIQEIKDKYITQN